MGIELEWCITRDPRHNDDAWALLVGAADDEPMYYMGSGMWTRVKEYALVYEDLNFAKRTASTLPHAYVILY